MTTTDMTTDAISTNPTTTKPAGSKSYEKWIYVFLIVAIFAMGFGMLMKVGEQPDPETIMKPSFFAKAEEIGAVVYRRFYAPINQERVVVLGVPPQPEWQRDIVKGFLEAAVAEKAPFDVLLVDDQMPAFDASKLPPIEIRPAQVNSVVQAQLVDQLNELKAAGKKVLLYTANTYSSHILPGNPINRLEKASGSHYFAISSGPMPLAPNQERIVEPACVGEQMDSTGASALGCAILHTARGYYRKQIKQDQFVAMMIAPRPNDYILMVSAPGQNLLAK